jgi:hypothetical protein
MGEGTSYFPARRGARSYYTFQEPKKPVKILISKILYPYLNPLKVNILRDFSNIIYISIIRKFIVIIKPEIFSSNGKGLLLGRVGIVLVSLIGVSEKIFEVVDDGDVEGAARAASDLLAEAEVVLGDLEEVPARARVRVRLQLLVPFHVLDLHVVVRHRFPLLPLRLPLARSVLGRD